MTTREAAVDGRACPPCTLLKRRSHPVAVLHPTNEPNDEKDDKNGSEKAAADVHEHLLYVTCRGSLKHEPCLPSVRDRTQRRTRRPTPLARLVPRLSPRLSTPVRIGAGAKTYNA